MTYQEFVAFTAGTCTHVVNLSKDGEALIGVYNGLAGWGKIYAPNGDGGAYDGLTERETLWEEFDEEENYQYCFNESSFQAYGYKLVK